jgi:hypothetical protein
MNLGTITADTSEDDLQSRLKVNLAAMETNPSPATPPANDIAAPKCATEGINFPQPVVEKFID